MKDFILSLGSYILGVILILTVCIKLFTKKPPTNTQTVVLLLFSFVLIALPFSSKISIDIKGVKLDLETATKQVSELQQTITELKNENAELTRQIGVLNNQIAVLSDPASTPNERSFAATSLTNDIRDINFRLSSVGFALDSAQLKSDSVMENLSNIKIRKKIFK